MNADITAAQQIIDPSTKDFVNALIQAGIGFFALTILLVFLVVIIMLLRFLGNRTKSDDKKDEAVYGMVHENREYRKEQLEATKLHIASTDRGTDATETLIRTIKANEAHSDGKLDGLNTNLLVLINEIGSVKDTINHLYDLTKNNPSEHATVIKTVEAQAAQINLLVELLRPPAPDIAPPEANTDNGGGLNTAA